MSNTNRLVLVRCKVFSYDPGYTVGPDGEPADSLPLDPADPRYEAFRQEIANRVYAKLPGELEWADFTAMVGFDMSRWSELVADAILALLITWPDKEPDNDR